MNKKLITTVAAATLLFLTACGTKNTHHEQAGDGKYAAKQELRWTEASTIATGDLSLATDTLSFNTLMNTQEGLYRLDKNGKPQPALAVKTKKSADGKTVLRPVKLTNEII